ncbi:MAG: alpha/beta hydrolase [Akkermansiaceae bacterium]|nr:alpha/beta hydrolase [Akkermansiaceae bacterium]
MTPFIRRYSSAEDARRHSSLRKVPSLVWKRFEDKHELRISFFEPEGHSAAQRTPAVMFYYGGMWALEYEEEFVAWATHLASRGVACFIPEYRNRARFDVTADEIVQEGIEAWQWLHSQAENLGIDPRRITLAGADAGGLMALNAAMQPIVRKRSWWRWGSQDELPLMPACVVIFRGVVDTEAPEARMLRVQVEAPEPDKINPCALLRRKLPPLFCVHGMLDPLLDYEMREWFCEEWKRHGNKAELILCPQADHTLTHFAVNPVVFEQVLREWEIFMVELGLWPEETIGECSLV